MSALPERVLMDAYIDEQHDELHTVVEVPRDLQACPRYGLTELHRVHDRRWVTVPQLPVARRATRCVGTGGFWLAMEAVGPSPRGPTRRTRAPVGGSLQAGMAVALSADDTAMNTISKASRVARNVVRPAVVDAAVKVALMIVAA